MTFYFKPPRGEIPLHKLQECIEERISYLEFVKGCTDISECGENFKFEYLTDGSAFDRTGHFMLRLLALRNPRLQEFLIETESILFEKRLKCLDFKNVQRELRTAHRHAEEILLSGCTPVRHQLFLFHFKKLCADILSRIAISHTFATDHLLNCDKYKLNVPFTFCLPLIAVRAVELNAGFAIIPCGKWAQLLGCLFKEHIKLGIQQLAASSTYYDAWEDDRVKYLFHRLNFKFKANNLFPSESKGINMSAKIVDQRSVLFPPCMKNLHSLLRLRHRLSHYSRFYYSLFLKDAGMPLMEAIEFWSQEYGKVNSSCTSCSHSWQRDSKRYVYSIRHMYGLEGSRREYRSPHCRQIQEMALGASSEGGCPFMHFDDKMLLNCLHDRVRADKDILEHLIQVKNNDGAQEACQMYLSVLNGLRTDVSDNFKREGICVRSPIQFYSFTIQSKTDCSL